MKIAIEASGSRTPTTLSARISVEVEVETNGYGRQPPIVGVVEKAVNESRRAVLAVLNEKVERG